MAFLSNRSCLSFLFLQKIHLLDSLGDDIIFASVQPDVGFSFIFLTLQAITELVGLFYLSSVACLLPFSLVLHQLKPMIVSWHQRFRNLVWFFNGCVEDDRKR